MKLKLKHVASSLFFLLSQTSLALAQSDTSTAPKGGAGVAGTVIMYLICNSSKRRAIGGWLLYYYIQLYAGALISLAFVLEGLKNFNPDLWSDKSLYSLYLLSTVPAYLATLTEVIVGSMLLRIRLRNTRTLDWLRAVLLISFIFAAISLVIDFLHWPDSVTLDLVPLFTSILWFLYFTKSRRVALVFKQANWDANVMYPLAPGTETKGVSKKWLKNYGIVLVVIIAVFLLLIYFSTSK